MAGSGATRLRYSRRSIIFRRAVWAIGMRSGISTRSLGCRWKRLKTKRRRGRSRKSIWKSMGLRTMTQRRKSLVKRKTKSRSAQMVMWWTRFPWRRWKNSSHYSQSWKSSKAGSLVLTCKVESFALPGAKLVSMISRKVFISVPKENTTDAPTQCDATIALWEKFIFHKI